MLQEELRGGVKTQGNCICFKVLDERIITLGLVIFMCPVFVFITKDFHLV